MRDTTEDFFQNVVCYRFDMPKTRGGTGVGTFVQVELIYWGHTSTTSLSVSAVISWAKIRSYTLLYNHSTLSCFTLCMDMVGCCPTSVLTDVVQRRDIAKSLTICGINTGGKTATYKNVSTAHHQYTFILGANQQHTEGKPAT